MKRSNATFLLGAVIGIPAFFVHVKALPAAAQVAWAVAVFACGIAAAALWSFERS